VQIIRRRRLLSTFPLQGTKFEQKMQAASAIKEVIYKLKKQKTHTQTVFKIYIKSVMQSAE
jgi:hypothetical protein